MNSSTETEFAEGSMNVRVTHSGITPTSTELPDFPMLRVDSDRMVYQEVLINGQYLDRDRGSNGRVDAPRDMFADSELEPNVRD